MAELQPAVLFRYENWIHAVSQAETQNEARIDVNVAFNGYRYWTLIFSQRATKGTGSRYQDGFVIGMSGGNNDTQNWIGEVEDLDVKMIRRGSNNFTATNGYVRDVNQYIGHIYYNWYHGYEDLVTYKFVCDTQTKTVRCYINQAYMGYGPLNFPTTEYSNGRLEVLKTWAQLGDSNCVSYLGDVWLWGCQTLEDAEDYNGGYNPGHKSHGEFLVHHSSHPSGRKMVSDSSHRMYGWKIGDTYDPPVPPDPPEPTLRTVTLVQTTGGTISASPMSGYDVIDKVTLSHTTWPNPQEGGYYTFRGYDVTGATLSGVSLNEFTFSGSDVTCSGTWTYTPAPPAPAPYTIRVRLKDGATPPRADYRIQISVEPNIWDLTFNTTDWHNKLDTESDLLEVVAANTTGVTRMDYLFQDCGNLESVALFDTSSVINMEHMFEWCYKLKTIPQFDTSSVTNMENMFYYCSSLTTIPLIDTSKVTNMYMLFGRCGSLTSIPQLDTSSVTNMEKMFYYCSSLTTVPLLNTSNVTNFRSMFERCTSLTTTPLFDTSSGTNMALMFLSCASLTTIPLFSTNRCNDMSSMFNACRNVQSGALALYNRASTQANVPTYHVSTFKNCGINTTTGAAELAQIPSDWKS